MKKLVLVNLFIFCITLITNAQWAPSGNGLTGSNVNSFTKNNSFVFVSLGSSVYKSSDNGTSWQYSNLTGTIHSLTANQNDIYAGFYQTGMMKSTDNGSNWSAVMYGNTINSLGVCGNNILAGYFAYFYPNTYQGVTVSTNNGISWIGVGLNEASGYCFAANDIFAFTGLQYYGVYRSSNSGLNWVQTSLNNNTVQALAVSGNTIYAGTFAGLYISTNNGANWTFSSLNVPVQSLTVSGLNVFAGTVQNGVYISRNSGSTWFSGNEGFDSIVSINAFIISNDYILAGTNGRSVWRRNLSEILGTENISNETPVNFRLYQNFPNPFNPATRIRFSIPCSGRVILKIYDIKGKEIVTLTKKYFSAGMHDIFWNAVNNPAGVYFYKFSSGDFSETKKMILIK